MWFLRLSVCITSPTDHRSVNIVIRVPNCARYRWFSWRFYWVWWVLCNRISSIFSPVIVFSFVWNQIIATGNRVTIFYRISSAVSWSCSPPRRTFSFWWSAVRSFVMNWSKFFILRASFQPNLDNSSSNSSNRFEWISTPAAMESVRRRLRPVAWRCHYRHEKMEEKEKAITCHTIHRRIRCWFPLRTEKIAARPTLNIHRTKHNSFFFDRPQSNEDDRW